MASLHFLANPARFLRLAAHAAVADRRGGDAVGGGLYLALFVSPPDYQQGETVRIMYVHVPAAWMAMMVYAAASRSPAPWRWSGVIRWPTSRRRRRRRSAPPSPSCAWSTGSLWGQPMWGTWWVWDARLTSVLVLFFLYLGHIALAHALRRPRRAARGPRDPGAGRGRQPADHQILGRLVEHAAPAGERHADRRADDRIRRCCAAAGHGGRASAAVLRAWCCCASDGDAAARLDARPCGAARGHA